MTWSMTYPLKSGEENWLCEFIQIPANGDSEVYVSGHSHVYNVGSHHYGLYRTTLDKLPAGEALNTPEPCFTGKVPMQYSTDFILLEQTSPGNDDFPAGVGLGFKAGEILLVQLHALNASLQDSSATLQFTLKGIDKSKVQQKMGLLQFYDPFIYIPQNSEATATLRCELPNDITLIEANAHFHLRGIDHKSFLDPPGSRGTTPFLETNDWEHPLQYHGNMQIAGGSHIRIQCKYRNPDSRVYIQGQSKFDNEMCSFWAYAYPAPERQYLACLGGDENGVGTTSCMDTAACLAACPPSDAPDLSTPGIFNVGPCYQKCMVDSCPSAAGLLAKINACTAANCKDACPGAGCQSCTASKCAAEQNACQSAACSDG